MGLITESFKDKLQNTLLSSDPRMSNIRLGMIEQLGPLTGKRQIAPTMGEVMGAGAAGIRQGERDYLQEQIMSTQYKILDDGRIAKIDLPTGKVTYEGEAKADYGSSIGELFADRDILQKQFDSGKITKEVFDRRNSYIDNRIEVLNEKRGTNSYSRRRILHRIAEGFRNDKDEFGSPLWTMEEVEEKLKEYDKVFSGMEGFYSDEDKLEFEESVTTSDTTGGEQVVFKEEDVFSEMDKMRGMSENEARDYYGSLHPDLQVLIKEEHLKTKTKEPEEEIIDRSEITVGEKVYKKPPPKTKRKSEFDRSRMGKQAIESNPEWEKWSTEHKDEWNSLVDEATQSEPKKYFSPQQKAPNQEWREWSEKYSEIIKIGKQ
jgi:hypothetical protein